MTEPERFERAGLLVEHGRELIDEQILVVARLRNIGASTEREERRLKQLILIQSALEDNLRRLQAEAWQLSL